MATDDAEVLAAVGPRLRALRTAQGLTLAQVSERTGISASTLSRLESGGRRPTLELLLPLTRTYQAPLDDLVTAQQPPDPRVRSRPITRHGETFLPLSRRPGGIQAFKAVYPPPTGDDEPQRQSHEGYEWLYVLSGRLRLLLGEHDLTLEPGEVVEFDTRLPHAIRNAGPGGAEALHLFGPQGERLHVRARSTSRSRSGSTSRAGRRRDGPDG